MRMKMEINAENAAFENIHTELARILLKVSYQVGDGDISGKIMDSNGNSVGHFEIE